ncbi:MAG: hypothetical protein WBL65_18170 [Bryobacteraceae bacterium]
MTLTGNPFVDAGLGIAASKADRRSVEELSSDDLKHSVRNLHADIQKLKNLKILASFWVNNPFMGKNLDQKPKFESFLQGLETGRLPTQAGHCQACGRSPVINSAATGCQADRCWFPLAGSGDSDPCTLPGLRGKAVCADCLSAVVVLPLGCRSCPDGPYFIHVTEPDLQAQAVSEGIAELGAAISTGAGAGIPHGTALRGRVALLDIVSGSVLWDHTQPGRLTRIPQHGAAIISFSNRGTGVCFYELHLPAQALKFFGAITAAGVRGVFLDWVKEIQRGFKKESGHYFDQLCDCVEERRSLAPFLLALVKGPRDRPRKLRSEEHKVLQIYEDIALQKKERFDTLQRIANKVRQMPAAYADSFIKQLGNLGSKRTLLELIKEFCKRGSTGLKITPSELRVIDSGPASEIASLLYLLCKTEEDGGDE